MIRNTKKEWGINVDYIYLGDRFTDIKYKGMSCNAIRNGKGKCIRGRNSNMLVCFENGDNNVILARLLRKAKKETNNSLSNDR